MTTVPLPLSCITVRNPWAEAIARGAKQVENRTRRTSYRGLIAIHTAQRDDPHAWRDPRIAEALDDLRTDIAGDHRIFRRRNEDGCTYGAIIAVAMLTDCHEARSGWDPCCPPWGETSDAGRVWHLVIADVHRLATPVPARGALQVPWAAPPDVAAAVRDQLHTEVTW